MVVALSSANLTKGVEGSCRGPARRGERGSKRDLRGRSTGYLCWISDGQILSRQVSLRRSWARIQAHFAGCCSGLELVVAEAEVLDVVGMVVVVVLEETAEGHDGIYARDDGANPSLQ